MGRLQPGERLLLADGREAVVETMEREYAPERVAKENDTLVLVGRAG